jgi:hypothetical protein
VDGFREVGMSGSNWCENPDPDVDTHVIETIEEEERLLGDMQPCERDPKWVFGSPALLGNVDDSQCRGFDVHSVGDRSVRVLWKIPANAQVEFRADSERIYLTFAEVQG